MSLNGYVSWRMRRTGDVDRRWLLALSGMDVAALTFSIWWSGRFESRYFPMLYFVLALFAWLFSSTYLGFSWTTLVAGLCAMTCVFAGDGLDLGQVDEKVLYYRLAGFYGVAVSVNTVTRFERLRRVWAVRREAELDRQRIEMSQTIHDSTAQSAYMLSLGLEQALEMWERGDAELGVKLR